MGSSSLCAEARKCPLLLESLGRSLSVITSVPYPLCLFYRHIFYRHLYPLCSSIRGTRHLTTACSTSKIVTGAHGSSVPGCAGGGMGSFPAEAGSSSAAAMWPSLPAKHSHHGSRWGFPQLRQCRQSRTPLVTDNQDSRAPGSPVPLREGGHHPYPAA